MKALPKPIAFEWDEGNIEKSWKKHKIHYREIEEVFLDKPIKIFPDAKHSLKEKRFVALGKTKNKVLLTVIFTIRNKNIRVISARKQNKKERGLYEETKEA